MTEITAHSTASAAGVSAALAPLSTRGATASGRMSQTVSPCGQSSKRVAIGAPIWPRPTNPTRPSVIDHGNCVRRAVLHGLVDGGALRLVGTLVEHGQHTFLRHGEHGRGLRLADSVTLAEVTIEHDPPAGTSRRR